MLSHADPLWKRHYANIVAEIGKRLGRLRVPIGDEDRYAPTRAGSRELLQYAIAVCSMFAFPRTMLALPRALDHISYCRISFPHSIMILALSTPIIAADPHVYKNPPSIDDRSSGHTVFTTQLCPCLIATRIEERGI